VNAGEILGRLYQLLDQVILLPIDLGQKGPRLTNWQQTTYEETQTDNYYERLLAVAERGGNIGVLLGPASGRLIALDLDDDNLVDQWLARHPWLADTTRSRGKRGCQFWLRLEPECEFPNGKAVYPLTENGGKFGEFRLGGAGGAQSVIWGVHPDGMRYEIVVAKRPIVISLADLDDLAPGIVYPEEVFLAEESSAAQPASNPSPAASGIWERVTRYLNTCEPAVSGKDGDRTTFRVLCHVISRFDLSLEQAWQAALYYNRNKCEPHWSEKELRHKSDGAWKATRSESRGELLASENETPLAKKLNAEQAQREQAEHANDDRPEGPSADAPIDLEKETEERIKRYTTTRNHSRRRCALKLFTASSGTLPRSWLNIARPARKCCFCTD
jgi:hypothetical protein